MDQVDVGESAEEVVHHRDKRGAEASIVGSLIMCRGKIALSTFVLMIRNQSMTTRWWWRLWWFRAAPNLLTKLHARRVVRYVTVLHGRHEEHIFETSKDWLLDANRNQPMYWHGSAVKEAGPTATCLDRR